MPLPVRERLSRLRRWAARHPIRSLFAGAVVLVAGGAAASYLVLVLSTLNAPPPAGLAGSGGLASPGRATAGPVACAGTFAPTRSFGPGPEGPWVVAGRETGGFVGYRAAEILAFEFVRAPNDAVARTTSVEGELTIHGTELTAAEVRARVDRLRSDVEPRDDHITEFFELRTHATATFTLMQPVDLGEPAEGRIVEVVAPGNLTIVETTRPVDFPLQARWNGDTIEVAGQLIIKRADYGLDVQQLLGFRVAEEITLELSLVFVRPGDTGCEPPTASAGPSAPPPSASAPPPRAATLERLPDDWGEIAFMGLTGEIGPWPGTVPAEVFVLRGGDGAPIQLTPSGEPLLDDEPAWSADGSRIAWVRYPNDLPPTLWIADDRMSAGSIQELLGASPRSPDWSPDGRFIIAVPADDFDTSLVVVDVAARTSTRLFNDPGSEDGPAWSPDGRTIALSLIPAGGNDEDIYLLDPDGTNLRQLTSDPAYEYQPAWSPDGRLLAFVRGGDLWVMRADGTEPQRLTRGLLVDSPTWSPDGERLAFVLSGAGPMNEGPERRSLWFVDADGSGLATMPLQLFSVAHPDWRPVR
jgi:polyisoprenoid-binding protein YceI